MTHPNLELIDRFFAAYGKRDHAALQDILAENATWTFPGHHPLSGTKVGIDAIIAFFDAVGSVMRRSHPQADKLVMGVNEQYVVECQHIRTNRADGPNLNQQLCVRGHLQMARLCRASTWQPTRMRSTRSILRS